MQQPPYDPASSPNGDGAPQTASRVAEVGGRVAAALDERKDSLAGKIDSVASRLREQAGRMPGGEKVAGAAFTTADAMESAADYLGAHDVEDMVSDVQQLVKRHPGVTLLTAAALGFLLARTFSRH